LSPTPSLGSSPSLRHHNTTHWPQRKTATTSSEHSWGQPPPYGSRNYRSPAPRSPSTAIRLLGDLDLRFLGPLRLQVFQSVHDLSHPGTKATALLVAQRFVWPGVQKDCRTWAHSCQSCQRSKVSRHTVTPLGDFPPPAARFLQVHLDLVGPLPTSAGYTYCLTAVDRFTRWPEVIPIPDIIADTVARALLIGWISHFGCPQTITTDEGRQFESHLFQSLARKCGIQLARTTAHHPGLTGYWNTSTGR
jgi:hypothetical protein